MPSLLRPFLAPPSPAVVLVSVVNTSPVAKLQPPVDAISRPQRELARSLPPASACYPSPLLITRRVAMALARVAQRLS